MADQVAILRGKLPAVLANAVSDAINDALRKGMAEDEACCVAIAVVADYGRGAYGRAYLEQLARVVRDRAQVPLPPGFA